MNGAVLKDIEVHLLQSRRDLLEETAELINRQWPKSMEHRMRGLDVAHGDGKSTLPCSLVMTFGPGRPVVAHAQLLPVMGKPESAYLHDVVVVPEFRGCGLGRQIMAAAESHAQALGIRCLHLFTYDKEQFYSHLGYEKGPVVSPLKRCTAKLDLQQVAVLLESVGEQKLSADSNVPSEGASCHGHSPPPPVPSPSAPPPPPPPSAPPPPPPPPPTVKVAPQTEPIGAWMMKPKPIL